MIFLDSFLPKSVCRQPTKRKYTPVVVEYVCVIFSYRIDVGIASICTVFVSPKTSVTRPPEKKDAFMWTMGMNVEFHAAT